MPTDGYFQTDQCAAGTQIYIDPKGLCLLVSTLWHIYSRVFAPRSTFGSAGNGLAAVALWELVVTIECGLFSGVDYVEAADRVLVRIRATVRVWT